MKTMNRSNLRHPSFLANIKSAIVEATRNAGVNRDTGVAFVSNARGERSLLVCAWVGKGFEVYDRADNVVTDAVKAALREYHSSQKAIPLIQIEFDSGHMAVWYLTMHGHMAGVGA